MKNRAFNSAVRLGAISFVNTVPVYADFQPSFPVELFYDVPARLNAMMLAGELDVSPVSSACYLRNRERFVLLDDLSVSSYGAVESVLFLSRKPFGPNLRSQLPVLSLPDDSETSIALLAFLLGEGGVEQGGVRGSRSRCPEGLRMREIAEGSGPASKETSIPVKTYHAPLWREALAETGNALVIGDNALTLRYTGIPEGIHCTDLSSLWQSSTGLPFVFAVWVANRSWGEANPQALTTLNAELCASRDRFFRNPAVFDKGLALARSRSGLSVETLTHYYRDCLDYRLTPDHHAALARFGQILLPIPAASGITRS